MIVSLSSSNIRIARLEKREHERYGDKIHTDPFWAKKCADFINWTKLYEDDTYVGYSRKNHLQWLKTLQCPILKIEGDTTIEERINSINNLIKD